uniref:transcription factor bHLH53-like n=1 Tax=Erigeron canadensis TaxID=72917 RepID=UPI001CB94026|nr:transcription factor bHLH53-like [Erigeron canadensis]
MVALSFNSNNWPTTFYQHHNNDTDVLPPPYFLPFHDNNLHFSTFNNAITTTNNNLPFHNSINFPTLSYNNNNNNPLSSLPTIAQQYYYPNLPFVSDPHDPYFFPMATHIEQTQPEYNSYQSLTSHYSYPLVYDMFPMEQMQPDFYDFGNACPNVFIDQDVQMKEHDYIGKGNGNGSKRLSAQSMAARVRRRKISSKTSELGKLVPGGHKMTTAEMFQAAYKYIRFLQAQVGVLQLMSSSLELDEELQAMIKDPSVQEKLYVAEKCIVSQTLAKTLADSHEE